MGINFQSWKVPLTILWVSPVMWDVPLTWPRAHSLASHWKQQSELCWRVDKGTSVTTRTASLFTGTALSCLPP